MENGPGQLNKAASAAYQQLPLNEREELRSEVKERKMTRKDMMRRSDKIFARIQKLVGNSIANQEFMCILHDLHHQSWLLTAFQLCECDRNPASLLGNNTESNISIMLLHA